MDKKEPVVNTETKKLIIKPDSKMIQIDIEDNELKKLDNQETKDEVEESLDIKKICKLFEPRAVMGIIREALNKEMSQLVTKNLSEVKYRVEYEWKNGRQYRTPEYSLDELSKDFGDGSTINEEQLINILTKMFKTNKNCKNADIKIIKLYDYVKGLWTKREVIWQNNINNN